MTRQDYDPTPTVLAMDKMTFHGNIIPLAWYHHLKFDSGKPHLVAIIILSDIVYWYRPVEIRDEETGKFIGLRSRFKGDMLQRSYEQLADRLGITKRQAKEAIDFLIEKGVLKREFRTIESTKGLLPNVTFLEPIPAKIAQINEHPDGGSYTGTGDGGTSQRTMGGTFKRNTNTEITCTETPSHPSREPESTKPTPPVQTRPQGKGWMEGLNQSQKESLDYLRRCGVKADHHLQAFCQLPLSVIEREWASVNSSRKARDKAACLITQLSNLPADPEPPTPVSATPKKPSAPWDLPSWATMSQDERGAAQEQYQLTFSAWQRKYGA